MSVNLPAFPALSLLQDRDGCYSLSQEGGITKRELFAAMAMQGFVSANDYPHVMLGGGHHLVDFAAASVRIADALLAQLEKDSP